MHALGVLLLTVGSWSVSACHTLACNISFFKIAINVFTVMLGCCKYSVLFCNGKAAGRKNYGNGAKNAENGRGAVAFVSTQGRKSAEKRLHGVCSKGDTCGCVRARTRAKRRGKRLHGACSKGDTVRLLRARTGAQRRG